MSVLEGNFAKIIEPQLKEFYSHLHGKHGAFSGHRYRRGRLRCKFCGAPSNTPKGGGMPTKYPKLFTEKSK